MTKLNARPEPVEVDFSKAALIVVDMQNAFASRRGMLDLAGLDISEAPRVVQAVKEVVDAARRARVPVVYLQMGYQPDLSDGGGPGSPNWHKELGIRMMNCQPELKGKLVTVGSWDFDIVDEIKPQPDDLVIVKTRYSGFARTLLDDELRKRGIRYLFFTGIATKCMRGIHPPGRVLPGLLAHSDCRRGHGQPAQDARGHVAQRRSVLRLDDSGHGIHASRFALTFYVCSVLPMID